jgi:Fe2+ transport system protein B
VGVVYLPCITSIRVLPKEFGWKSAANLASALLVGGILASLLALAF